MSNIIRMTVLPRSVLLILVLLCAERCNCNSISPTSESVSPPLSEPSDLNTVNDNVNGDGNQQRKERGLTTADEDTNSDDEADGRSARCLLGSARHLRKHDADQVAKYFMSGGPLNGLSHFVGAAHREFNDDNDESPAPKRENCDKESTNENLKTDSNEPLVGAAHIPTFYVPHSAAVHGSRFIHPYNSIIPGLPAIPHSRAHAHRLYPALPPAYSHPEPYFYGYERSGLPHSVLRAATALPARGLMRARNLLNNLIPVQPGYQYALNDHVVGSSYVAPGRGASERTRAGASKYTDAHYTPILGASNPAYEEDEDLNGRNKPKAQTPARSGSETLPSYDPAYGLHPSSALNLFHPQPSGYIVRLIPHVTPPPPSNQMVGSVQEQSSNCTKNDEPVVGEAEMSITEKPETVTPCNESKGSQDEEQHEEPEDSESEGGSQNSNKERRSREEPLNPVKNISKKSIDHSKSKAAPA